MSKIGKQIEYFKDSDPIELLNPDQLLQFEKEMNSSSIPYYLQVNIENYLVKGNEEFENPKNKKKRMNLKQNTYIKYIIKKYWSLLLVSDLSHPPELINKKMYFDLVN